MAHAHPSQAIRTYGEFWPFYLGEHAQGRTRRIHIAGTLAALALLAAAVILRAPWLILAALAIGYGPAWYAHFFVEKNRPATFRYPLWSLYSDLRMVALWTAGRLDTELKKAGIPPS